MKLLDDTRNANASFYLDEDGDEIDRAEFVEALWTGANTGVMLYHGPGFVKLQVAVLTTGEDVCSVYDAFEDWCRETGRLDEIGEDDPQNEDFGIYQSSFQFIPAVPPSAFALCIHEDCTRISPLGNE